MANISGRSPYIFYMLCVILLLVLTAAMATRPLKTDLLHRGSAQTGTEDSLQGSFQQGALKADLLEESTEELSCEGLEEEECLNRRSLAAHTDYIYTQHHKHP